jgi:hypothetical protein
MTDTTYTTIIAAFQDLANHDICIIAHYNYFICTYPLLAEPHVIYTHDHCPEACRQQPLEPLLVWFRKHGYEITPPADTILHTWFHKNGYNQY